MNDDQIEDLLRRLRPAGPAPGLRGRMLGAGPAASGRAWPWAAAAAALLALVIGLRASTDRVYGAVQQDVTGSGGHAVVDEMPALQWAVGDEQVARRLIEELARIERLAAPAASPAGESWQP